MKRRFRVEFNFVVDNELATAAEIRAYIRDAVETWSGSLRPPGALGADDDGDPLWGIHKVSSIRVVRHHDQKGVV